MISLCSNGYLIQTLIFVHFLLVHSLFHSSNLFQTKGTCSSCHQRCFCLRRLCLSFTSKPVRCGSADCLLFGKHGCSEDKIWCHFPENSVTRVTTYGDIHADVVAVNSTDGKNPQKGGFCVQFSLHMWIRCCPNRPC